MKIASNSTQQKNRNEQANEQSSMLCAIRSIKNRLWREWKTEREQETVVSKQKEKKRKLNK